MLSEDAARKLADMVRRLEAQVKGIETRERMTHSGDNEWIIDAVATADCSQWALGQCQPNLGSQTFPLYYWNTLGDITTGQDIVIAYSHRSSGSTSRYSSADTPTPWIVIAASCNETQAMAFNNPGSSMFLGMM